MGSDARPAGPATGLFLLRSIHHIGFYVSDLRAAIGTWLAVYRAGPFYGAGTWRLLVDEEADGDDLRRVLLVDRREPTERLVT